MKKSNDINLYSMKSIAPIICEYLSRDKEVIFTARGNSMRPLLRNGKDQLILKKYGGEALEKGDVILYQRTDQSFSAHRIVGQNDKGYILLGDFQTRVEEGIQPSKILAVVVGFIRNDREFSVNSVSYRRYVRFWSSSRVIRKGYIFMLSKIMAVKRRLSS